MNFENLWTKLKILVPDDEPFFTYSEMVQMIDNNPSEQIVYMDLLFRELSIQRMQQLYKKHSLKELSINYFHMQAIDKGWHLMKVNLNAPMKEYKLALNYVKISRIVYQRNISLNEAKEALHILLLLAEEWIKEFGDSVEVTQILTVNNQIEANKEITPSTPEASDFPVIKPVKITEKIILEADNTNNQPESQLLKQLRVLQSSSKESVADADNFGELRNYMHVVRPIQLELEKILKSIKNSSEPQLILLCGSVGDGKSHLLAYLKEKHPELLNDFYIHNDSTESFNPSKDSLETLELVLDQFDHLPSDGKNIIIAINLGVLHNFYNKQRSNNRFIQLCNFIDKTGIFNQSEISIQSDNQFHVLNYADYQPYELTNSGASSIFFTNILEKITAVTTENPFYNSWIKDKENGVTSITHQNFGLLLQPEIKQAIVTTLIKSMVQQKIIVSTRSFYNLLYDIIVPVIEENKLVNKINYMLPNLLFGHPDRSHLLEAIHKLDPIKYRSNINDQLVSEFMLSIDLSQKVKQVIEKTKDLEIWSFISPNIKNDEFIAFSKLLVRQYSLLFETTENQSYLEFINYLFHYYHGNEDEIGSLFELISDVLFKWKGSPKQDYIFIDSPNKLFRTAYPLQIEPAVDEQRFGSFNGSTEISKFIPSIAIGFEQNGKNHLFELDYSLYDLLKKIQKGYRPNRKDILNAIQFSEFYESLIRNTDKTKNMLIVSTKDGMILELKKPKFSTSKYEVKQVH
ncbi:DNA phosphorothioation-dependent restriction protein DptF [Bacillus sp. OAE603]|uniref:DNA phosphorothioation-dependent restriction protein DptF n=1 Tax=Gottfriedia sp. OAE603 TaxID=2663872 RepID=UPI00178AD6B3